MDATDKAGGPQPRPGVMEISAYVPGRHDAPGAVKVHKLSSNETPLGASPKAIAAAGAVTGQLELYPDGSATRLREAIAGSARLDGLVLRDAATGLFTLPAGGPRADGLPASQALASPRLRAVLVELRRRFDAIVIDCPPLLPVIDARIIAAEADAAVLVAAWQRTPKQLARQAIRNLGPACAKLAGVVIYGVDPAELPHLEASMAQQAADSYPPRAA